MKGQNKGTQFYAWAESKIGGKAYICPVILTLHFGIGIGIDFSFVVEIGPKGRDSLTETTNDSRIKR